jgi:hypothetical protein
MLGEKAIERIDTVMEHYNYIRDTLHNKELIAAIITVALKLEEVGDLLQSIDTTINEK